MQNNCHIAQRDPKITTLAHESGRNVACNWLLNTSCVSALKLLELATAIILGIVEDEKCFSTLNFMKDKLRNKLMIHFDLVTHM
jgi:hypothetical protein